MDRMRPGNIALPKSFVVGVADTTRSDDCIRAAFALAAELDAKVELVHAVHTPVLEWMAIDPTHEAGSLERIVRETKATVGEHLAQMGLGDRAMDAIGRMSVRPGQAAKVLLEAAKAVHGDLLVLGSHDRRGWLDLGSTARVVLAKSSVPVLVQRRPPLPIREILVPVDLSEDSLAALGFAVRFAEKLGARIRVVEAFDVGRLFTTSPDAFGYVPRLSIDELREEASAAFERAVATFDWQGVEYRAEFVDGAPGEVVLDLARTADCIAMSTHGRGGLARALLGSVAQLVIQRSETPVIAIPHPRRAFAL